MKKFLSFLLCFLGISFITFGLYLVYIRYSPKTLAFEHVAVNSTNHSSLPRIIRIDSINATLPVFPAEIKNNTWETNAQGVSFLVQSAKPGNTGNSVFYGHNWNSILGKLNQTKPGDMIEVIMDTGKKYLFIVEYTAVVDPTQTSIVNDVGDTRLTIYTCTGFLDTKRFVVIAKPKK